ncbi:hypothetical protein ADUPG1_008852, partial [Aduncisulcus paluster]
YADSGSDQTSIGDISITFNSGIFTLMEELGLTPFQFESIITSKDAFHQKLVALINIDIEERKFKARESVLLGPPEYPSIESMISQHKASTMVQHSSPLTPSRHRQVSDGNAYGAFDDLSSETSLSHSIHSIIPTAPPLVTITGLDIDGDQAIGIENSNQDGIPLPHRVIGDGTQTEYNESYDAIDPEEHPMFGQGYVNNATFHSSWYPVSLKQKFKYIYYNGSPPLHPSDSFKQLLISLVIYLPFALYMLIACLIVGRDALREAPYIPSQFWQTHSYPFLPEKLFFEKRFQLWFIGAGCGAILLLFNHYKSIGRVPVKMNECLPFIQVVFWCIEMGIWIVGMFAGFLGCMGCLLYNVKAGNWMVHMFFGPVRICVQIILNIVSYGVQALLCKLCPSGLSYRVIGCVFTTLIHYGMSLLVYYLLNTLILDNFIFTKNTAVSSSDTSDSMMYMVAGWGVYHLFICEWISPFLESIPLGFRLVQNKNAPDPLSRSSYIRRCAPWFMVAHYCALDMNGAVMQVFGTYFLISCWVDESD